MIEQKLNVDNGDEVYITIYDRLNVDDVFQHFVKKGIFEVIAGKEISTATTKVVRDDFMRELR